MGPRSSYRTKEDAPSEPEHKAVRCIHRDASGTVPDLEQERGDETIERQGDAELGTLDHLRSSIERLTLAHRTRRGPRNRPAREREGSQRKRTQRKVADMHPRAETREPEHH